jgi:nitroreductase
MTQVIDKLNWRYATKKFDPAKKLDEAVVERIIEAARLAPTSSGLQPFEVFVVKNPTCARRSVKWAGTSRRSPKRRTCWSSRPGTTSRRSA